MTRVEKNTSVTQQLEEMKGSVMREVRDQNKKKRPALTCSLILLLAVVGFVVWVLWLAAATGLVKMPWLTSLAYDAPHPVRSVEPGTPVEVFVEEALMSELTARLQSGNGEIQNRAVALSISEESFTASLRSLLEESGMAILDASGAQLVIDTEAGVELFVPLFDNPRDSAVTLTLDVGVVDGNVSITPTHLTVGNLSVPRLVVSKLVAPLLQQQLEKLNEILLGYATIDSMAVGEGELTLTGELSVEIQ